VFGGREDELKRLNRWLEDDETPPRFLLAAPAGRGKSALLVHWIARLETKGVIGHGEDCWRLVFVPISIRFRTNRPEVYYEAIARGIAEILGEDIAPPRTDPAAYYEDRCRMLLEQAIARNQRVLIVIDGLDESLGERFSAAWFPRRLGARLRLLVSARLQVGDRDASGWLERLSWQAGVRVATCDLPSLHVRGVAVLVNTAGIFDEHAGAREGLATTLHTLTGGEPLLLKLLVEDLRERSDERALVPGDLQRIQPGLRGYFEDWLDRQREVWRSERRDGLEIDEPTISAYLAVLGCAYGPLTAEELNDVARRVHPIAPAFRTEEALFPLRRFVVGTGRRSQQEDAGFVLSHPRFGEFLRDEYFDHIRIEQTQAAFADWGRDILRRLAAGELPPARTPSYALEYLGQHFDDVAAPPATLMALTEEPWMRAWEALEGGHRGFSEDVVRARKVAERTGHSSEPYRAWQLRCNLIVSSIASSGANLPAQLLLRCVEAGIVPVRQALHWADYQSSENRAKTLTGLAAYMPEGERPNVLAEALNAAISALSSTDGELGALVGLVPVLPEDLLPRAFEVVAAGLREIGEHFAANLINALSSRDLRRACQAVLAATAAQESGLYRGYVRTLGALAPILPESLLCSALDAIEALDDGRYWEEQTQALVLLGPFAPEDRRVALQQRVLQRISTIGLAELQERFLVSAAPQLDHEALRQALSIARAMDREQIGFATVAALAPHLRADLAIEAFDILWSRNALWNGPEAIAAVAAHLPDPVRTERFAQLLDHLQGSSSRRCSAAVRALAPHLPETLIGTALTRAESIADGGSRTRAIIALFPRLVGPDRDSVIEEVLQAVRAIEDSWTRGQVLAEAVKSGMAEAILIEEALNTIALQPQGWARLDGLVGIAPWIPSDLGEKALEIALGIEQRWRVEALALIAPRIKPVLLTRVLQHVEQLTTDKWREEILQALAPYLNEEQLAMAIDLARTLGQSSRRATLVGFLAPYLSDRLLADALSIARAVGDDSERAKVLGTLASLLPDTERPPLIAEALEAIAAVRLDSHRADAIAKLGPLLSYKSCSEVVGYIVQMRDATSQCIALASVAALLDADDRTFRLKEALAAASQVTDDISRAEALVQLLPHLDEQTKIKVFVEAYETIRRVSSNFERTRLFARLLDFLPERDVLGTLGEETLTEMRAFASYNSRRRGLGDTRFDRGRLDEMLGYVVEIALRIPEPGDRARGLALLLRHFSADERARFYGQLVETIGRHSEDLSESLYNPWPDTAALADVATELEGPDCKRLFGAAFQQVLTRDQDDDRRASEIATLAPHLPEEMAEASLSNFIAASTHLPRPRLLELLPNLLPLILRFEGLQALQELARSVRETGHWFH
jgi:hypothetical protein